MRLVTSIAVVCWCLAVATLGGCKSPALSGTASTIDLADILNDRIAPSNCRNWLSNMGVLAYADFQEDRVRICNIRNCNYLTPNDYVLHYYDKTYDLNDLQSVDFIVVPFRAAPILAHTMMSFGFADGQYLGVSVEVRLEEGESYNPVLGLLRQYELTYVVADERDLIRLRTRHRDADVYVYRARATPDQVRELFRDVMSRVNELATSPEFYDTLVNNCMTNIARHVNQISPSRVPYGTNVLLPGYSDRYAYDLGLLDTDVSFDETKSRAWVNALAERYHDDPEFSRRIRR